jgi:hypothetical protein
MLSAAITVQESALLARSIGQIKDSEKHSLSADLRIESVSLAK